MATSPRSTTRTVTGPELRSIKVRRGAESCVCFSFVDVPGGIWVRSLRPMAREGGQNVAFFAWCRLWRPRPPATPQLWGGRPRTNFRSWVPSDLPPGAWARRGGLGGQCGRFLWSPPGLLPALWGTFGGLGFVAPDYRSGAQKQARTQRIL